MSKLRISAIVPYFEAHKTIKSALSSLLKGDLPPDEIVVVNDGSSQKSRELLEDIVSNLRSSSIKIFDHKHNLGGGFARNTAVLHSNNEWIFCLDADNLAPKKLLRSLAKFLEENPGRAEIVCPERVAFFDDVSMSITHTWTFRNSDLNAEEYLKRSVLPGASGNYLFSRESWYKSGGYPISTRALDAWGFGLRQHLSGHKTLLVPGTFYLHRIGTSSYYVRESKDMERLSLLATAQILENASQLPVQLVRSRLSWRKARTWLKRVKAPTSHSDPRLRADEGYATQRGAMQPGDLEDLEGMLLELETRADRV